MEKGENHHGSFLDKKSEYSVIDCIDCGFKHIIPIPNNKKMDDYYQNHFSEERIIEDRFIEDIDWWNLVHDEKFELLEKYMNKSDKIIYDIGCGFGYFMLRGKQRGWKTYGIDPSKKAVLSTRQKNLDTSIGTILKNNLPDHNADAIHMQDVIEHLPDPISSLNSLQKKLKPGGLLCILSPNDYNPLQKMIQKNLNIEPWWVNPPIHINYFDYAGIKTVLEKSGFELLEYTSSFPLEFFLLMGENYIGNDVIGRKIHSKRKSFDLFFHEEQSDDLRKNIYKSLSSLGLGREFLLIAKSKLT